MWLKICWKSHQQQNVQIARIIIFLTFSLSAQRTPRNVFMWIHPQCYLPVFNQGKRFGKLDFGPYREFLVSFGVVADLKCRVGCWKISAWQFSRKCSFNWKTVSKQGTFLTLQLSNLLLLVSLRTRKHTSMVSRAIFSDFPENAHSTFRDCRIHFCTFSDNLSRKSCLEGWWKVTLCTYIC